MELGNRPRANLLAVINDSDLVRLGNVDEGATSVARQLESFRVRRELYVRDLGPSGWVNDRESTASVTHYHPAGVSIDADVIRVFTEFDRTHRPEVFGAEERD